MSHRPHALRGDGNPERSAFLADNGMKERSKKGNMNLAGGGGLPGRCQEFFPGVAGAFDGAVGGLESLGIVDALGERDVGVFLQS